jgi:hypothetical protein
MYGYSSVVWNNVVRLMLITGREQVTYRLAAWPVAMKQKKPERHENVVLAQA